MYSQRAIENEFCPSCGSFVDRIVAETGWCVVCSGDTQAVCIGCNDLFVKDQPHRKLCPWCREERWLLRHADEIERYLADGFSIHYARREIYESNRPVCISCGNPIKGATNGAMFCKQTIECRRWRRRYRTVREQYLRDGIIDPAKKAVAQVSAEIFAATFIMEIGEHE